MVKVSVIVPVYNAEEYLGDCLDSLCNQTLEDIEIITINDGSIDRSLQILEEYAAKDCRIKIISQKNSGPSVARNRGVAEAVGEYVSFVDSDDWVDTDFLERLYLAAKKYNADIAGGGMVHGCSNEKSKKLLHFCKTRLLKSFKEKFKFLLGGGRLFYVWNKIYKREALLRSGISFKKGVFYEDIYWSLQVMKCLGEAVCVSEIFYHYRYNPRSIVNTTSHDDKKVNDMRQARTFAVKFAGQNNLDMPFSVHEKRVIKLLGIPFIVVKSGDVGHKIYILGMCCLEIKLRKRR